MGSEGDVGAVTQVVLRERQARDRGWWDQMRDCLDPDAHIRTSWFSGTGEQFVVQSERMSANGDRATHRLSPPVVRIRENRALVEVSAAIEVRASVGDALADITSYTRLIYRLENRHGRWWIVALDPIYERDTLLPTVAGDVPQIDKGRLAQFREPYQFLSYYLALSGYDVRGDLCGDDRPDEVRELYRQAFSWLESGRPNDMNAEG